jgi:hypothetical protein
MAARVTGAEAVAFFRRRLRPRGSADRAAAQKAYLKRTSSSGEPTFRPSAPRSASSVEPIQR